MTYKACQHLQSSSQGVVQGRLFDVQAESLRPWAGSKFFRELKLSPDSIEIQAFGNMKYRQRHYPINNLFLLQLYGILEIIFSIMSERCRRIG